MLGKQNRLSAQNVAVLFKTARPAGGAFFVARYMPEGPLPRFAVIAPKTIAKTAVLRNSLRRKWYSSLREAMRGKKVLPGIYALVLKKEAITIDSKERLNALEAYLKRYIHA